ncbi:unnamed protein product [Dracunculus medinensis]|uniref:MICOS complex subunit MIC10 n=1 Tax=Dracunculus medinensis TaxID=318479 RepID=A0A0N4U1I9_DRAME|nr:unnamed protein product [Dracunculus medinensis]
MKLALFGIHGIAVVLENKFKNIESQWIGRVSLVRAALLFGRREPVMPIMAYAWASCTSRVIYGKSLFVDD